MNTKLLTLLILFHLSHLITKAQIKEMDLWGNTTPPIEKQDWKDPSKSFLSSFLLPGTGQMYNDQVFIGLGITISELTLVGFGTYFLTLPRPNSDNVVYNAEKKNDYERNAIIFYSIAGVIHVAQCIQAPIYSHNRNKINNYVANQNKIGEVNIGYSNNSLALSISF